MSLSPPMTNCHPSALRTPSGTGSRVGRLFVDFGPRSAHRASCLRGAPRAVGFEVFPGIAPKSAQSTFTNVKVAVLAVVWAPAWFHPSGANTAITRIPSEHDHPSCRPHRLRPFFPARDSVTQSSRLGTGGFGVLGVKGWSRGRGRRRSRQPGRKPIRVVVRGDLEVGRDCDGLLLGDPRTSRRHATLMANAGGLTVARPGKLQRHVRERNRVCRPHAGRRRTTVIQSATR